MSNQVINLILFIQDGILGVKFLDNLEYGDKTAANPSKTQNFGVNLGVQ